MAEGRCGSCRFWRFEPWRYQPVGHTPLADAMSTCARMDHNGDYPEDGRSLAWAFVGGEDAVVFTKAEFGCVMWEGTPDG